MAARTLEPADPDRFWHAEGKMKVSVQDTYGLDEVPDASMCSPVHLSPPDSSTRANGEGSFIFAKGIPAAVSRYRTPRARRCCPGQISAFDHHARSRSGVRAAEVDQICTRKAYE
jgi:hypothetical protein